jgi:hypothetical protein
MSISNAHDDAMEKIRNSGLWNVQYPGRRFLSHGLAEDKQGILKAIGDSRTGDSPCSVVTE